MKTDTTESVVVKRNTFETISQIRPSRLPLAVPAMRRGLSQRALNRVSEYIARNFGAHLTLNDLARAACVSRAHFARLFRISMGTSPMAYLQALRVEHAKVLLNGERQICEIAADLGFCDQSHFTRVFRRLTGITPRDYARLQA